MESSYKVIKSPLLTERLQRLAPQGIYGFWVDRDANKIQIRKAVEDIYKVKVEKVNVVKMPSKRKRIRIKEGHTSAWKKAIIRVKKGQSINLG